MQAIEIPMWPLGTHGCGYTAVRYADGTVTFIGNCTTCGPDGPQWSGAAREALQRLAAQPEDQGLWEYHRAENI